MTSTTVSYNSFESFDFGKVTFASPSPNPTGKGKTVQVSLPRDLSSKFSTPKDLRQKWNIKPEGDEVAKTGKVKEYEKFSLEVDLDPDSAFETAAKKFDTHVMEQAYAKKREWFGSKSDDYESANDLKGLQGRMLKKGTESKDGKKQPNSVRFKVEGWAPYFVSALQNEKQPTLIKECVWKSRSVDEENFLKDNHTKFYLHNGKDQLTGVDKYIGKVTINDAAGSPTKDASGNFQWRYVGPQDCKANSLLQIVFAVAKIHIADTKFYTILTAKEVFIKPPPPKVSGRLEGVEIVNTIDPQMAAKAVQNTVIGDSEVNSDVEDNASIDDKPDTGADGGAGGAGGVGGAPSEVPSATGEVLKRKRDAGQSSPSKAKTAKSAKDAKPKTIAVEEEF